MDPTIEHLIDVLSLVAGVLVGGLVTYWATVSAAERRWKHEKKDRRAAAEREGIAKALEWLDPIDRAIVTANLEVSSLLQFHRDDEEFLASFPSVLSALAKLDPSPAERLLLPPEAYELGHRIARGLDEARTSGIMWFQRAKMEKKPMLGLSECGRILDAASGDARQLRELLTQAYRGTFD